MPEEDGRLIQELGLDFVVLEAWKKGKVLISPPSFPEEVHWDIKYLRDLMRDITELYKKPGVKKEDFEKVFEKNRKRRDDAFHDAFSSIENFREDKQFKIVKKVTKGKKVFIELEELPAAEKAKYIKGIVDKLMLKMTPEQLRAMLEQSVKKLNDLETLKKADKALEKKKPEIKGSRGCYKLVIDDIDLFLIG